MHISHLTVFTVSVAVVGGFTVFQCRRRLKLHYVTSFSLKLTETLLNVERCC